MVTETRGEVRDRLRALIRTIEARPQRPPVQTEWRPRPRAIEEVFPTASRRETPEGACTYIEEVYPLDYYVGAQPLHHITHLDPALYALLAPNEDLEDATLDDLLFLDIESTGLGGAGALAFLVATGRFEERAGAQAFVLRQYLATSPPEEAAVLDAVIEDGRVREGDTVLVTYNGRAFDAPMLDERATMHRRRGGFDVLRHLDLLPPMRTGLRGAIPSCRLSMIETELLSATRPHTEIEGSQVPAWYYRFLRTGDARMLVSIVEHNAQDVVALGAILARFAALSRGASEATPLDAVALGRLHAARGAYEPAVAYLDRALTALAPSLVRDDTLLRLATVHRRIGRRDLAEPLWREAASRPGAAALRPLVELAKALEHDRRDFSAAHVVTLDALARLDLITRHDPPLARRWRDQLEARRVRLERRIERRTRITRDVN